MQRPIGRPQIGWTYDSTTGYIEPRGGRFPLQDIA